MYFCVTCIEVHENPEGQTPTQSSNHNYRIFYPKKNKQNNISAEWKYTSSVFFLNSIVGKLMLWTTHLLWKLFPSNPSTLSLKKTVKTESCERNIVRSGFSSFSRAKKERNNVWHWECSAAPDHELRGLSVGFHPLPSKRVMRRPGFRWQNKRALVHKARHPTVDCKSWGSMVGMDEIQTLLLSLCLLAWVGQQYWQSLEQEIYLMPF